MSLARQRFAIVRRRQRVEQADGHGDGAAMPQDAQGIGLAAFPTVPADNRNQFAKIDRDRANRNPLGRRSDGIEQGRPEGKELAPVAGRPFGEHGERLRMVERVADPPHLAMRVAALGTVDVQGAILVGEPADEGRPLDLRLGHERGPD